MPPPLISNEETSRIPCLATSNRSTSSFSTTTSPTLGLMPSSMADLINSRSDWPTPSTQDTSTSEPTSTVWVWYEPTSTGPSKMTPWRRRLSEKG